GAFRPGLGRGGWGPGPPPPVRVRGRGMRDAAGVRAPPARPYVGVGERSHAVEDASLPRERRRGQDLPVEAVEVLDERLLAILGVDVVANGPSASVRELRHA